MKHMTLILTISLLLLAAPSVTAQDKWQVLFNGKSVDAWRGYQRNSFPGRGWAIENGTLKTIVGGDRCDLITKEKFKNFVLELEWRVSPAGNSGVLYRVTEGPVESWHTGPEMQVLDDTQHRDGKNPKTSAGALYALIAPMAKALRPVGEFNKARLVVRNNQVEHWLNGKKVLEYELGSEEVTGLIKQSKFKDLVGFMRQSEGHIALQHHGEEVWYRNIRIRRLP